MKLIALVLFTAGAALIGLAHYWFIMNTRYESHDVMGASITFDQPFALGALLVCIAAGIKGWLVWYLCVGLFVTIEMLSLLYKWQILDRIVAVFRRPNPENMNIEQSVAQRRGKPRA